MFGSSGVKRWRGQLRSLLNRARGKAFPEGEVEALLYEADLSPAIVTRLLRAAQATGDVEEEKVLSALEEETISLLREIDAPELNFAPPKGILLLGVNGAGKTTAAAKLAYRLKEDGIPVVLAAADTFRAGAIEQLQQWGEKSGTEVVAKSSGADPAAVAFDGWQQAVRSHAVMIADTAGRLHTKVPLIEQLSKIVRVLEKDGQGAPHERFLVLDATLGQNSLAQAREFMKAIRLTGLIVTKLDGTARGGAALSSAVELGLPLRYLGVGEKITDLLPFEPTRFARELLRG